MLFGKFTLIPNSDITTFNNEGVLVMSEFKLARPSKPDKPLGRTQQFLIELKTTIVLLRDVLVEVKELAVVVAMIAFFVWGVIELFNKLH